MDGGQGSEGKSVDIVSSVFEVLRIIPNGRAIFSGAVYVQFLQLYNYFL
jgi:hypothetical protein